MGLRRASIEMLAISNLPVMLNRQQFCFSASTSYFRLWDRSKTEEAYFPYHMFVDRMDSLITAMVPFGANVWPIHIFRRPARWGALARF